MSPLNFVTVRLGKDSIDDINKISTSAVGIHENPFQIVVKCTQIPDNYAAGDYAFIWLGSDNSKGAQTEWKQGFKAVGKVVDIRRGKSRNDTSETVLDICFIFKDAVSRIDILRCAPDAYYWCASLPIIGIDDHANQTIRLMGGNYLSDIKAFFYAIDKTANDFKSNILKVEPGFKPYFEVVIPSPKENPDANSLLEAKGNISSKKSNYPLQQIFYGAPGTGKSHKTNEVAKKYSTIRTTFHPDSDYSTFVGAYKPKTVTEERYGLNGSNTVALTYPEGERSGKPIKDRKIEYRFVKQAFMKAYVKAWKLFVSAENPDEVEPQFLVIEEINRGNCAQIFGDLFQLLDRKDGFSEYPIEADDDIRNSLLCEDSKADPSFGEEGLQLTDKQRETINNVFNDVDSPFHDVASEIACGQVLVLPSNLYIWATMNTSDQSLFPIDSAFKRRWDWKYLKIKEGKDKNGNNLDWTIDISQKDENGKEKPVSWWAFIQKINEIIASMTSSADKQLGYFFCKADKKQNETDSEATVISADAFVGKVLFYLWNDVFKDYGFEDASLFRYKSKEEDEEKETEKDLTFPDFYDKEGEQVNTVRVTDFVGKVMNWKKNNEENG